MTEIISALRARHSILLIEHDMDAVFALADRITVLVEGAVIAEGSSAEISQNPAVREAYLGREDEAC
jgi:branched-chain amino acid transport system ATP-binding protein